MCILECANHTTRAQERVTGNAPHHHGRKTNRRKVMNERTQKPENDNAGLDIKTPRLFYYEDAEDCWTPYPDSMDNIIDINSLEEGEALEIQFKRVDMTDSEFENLPDI